MPSPLKSSSPAVSRASTPPPRAGNDVVAEAGTPRSRSPARPEGMPAGRTEARSSSASRRMPPRGAGSPASLRGESPVGTEVGVRQSQPASEHDVESDRTEAAGKTDATEKPDAAALAKALVPGPRGSVGGREVTLANVRPADVEEAQRECGKTLEAMMAAVPPEQAEQALERASVESFRQPSGDGSSRLDAESERAIGAYLDGQPTPPPRAGQEATPQGQLQLVLHRASHAPALPAPPAETPDAGRLRRTASAVVALLAATSANTARSTSRMVTNSVANVGTRNLLAVAIPTLLRQYISQGIEQRFLDDGTSRVARTAIGAVMPSIATTALVAGAARDWRYSDPTVKSVASRTIMGGFTAGIAVASGRSGAMADSAALMMAFTCYTAMRDLGVQSWLRLDNPDSAAHEAAGHAQDWKHYAAISLLYGLYQGLVSLGMDLGASPSGAGAAGLGLAAKAIFTHAAIRAAINFAGEVGEDLTFQGIPAVRSAWAHRSDPSVESLPLRLGIHTEPSVNNFLNGMMGGFAVRTGILSMTLGMVTMLTEPGSVLRNPMVLEALGDALIGITNALLYHPFANAGSAQPVPPPSDTEMAVVPARTGAGEGTDPAPERTGS